MRCHECEAPAEYTARSGGIRVGLCGRHLREHLDQFPGDDIKSELLRD